MNTFHVEPQGAPLVIDLGDGYQCTKLSVGPMDNNAYLLTPPSGPSVLIDAPAEAERLLELVGGRDVATLVTTHQHHDHIGATAAVAEATGADLVCGEPDRAAIEAGTGTQQRGVWDGDSIALSDTALSVVGLVGHTPGSIALVFQPGSGATHVWSGDCLFPGGAGRVSNPEEFDSLMTGLETKIFGAFPDETIIHPGHGDSTTLGVERPHLSEWRERGW